MQPTPFSPRSSSHNASKTNTDSGKVIDTEEHSRRAVIKLDRTFIMSVQLGWTGTDLEVTDFLADLEAAGFLVADILLGVTECC